MVCEKTCTCGSGLPRRPLYDARNIFVAYVCDQCEAGVKGHYRPDIFTDPQYWTDEPVEPEDNLPAYLFDHE